VSELVTGNQAIYYGFRNNKFTYLITVA